MSKLWPESERGRAIAAYALTLILCLAYMTATLKLWRADVFTPFGYGGDCILFLSLTKGAVENGWYLSNPYVGAPVGLEMRDFPMSEGLHFLIMKGIGAALGSYAAAYNVYFLLGFPLTALTSLFVLRQFKIPFLPAMVAALLFAFHPFHFFRNQGHLFLATYYLVPCLIMVALWLYMDRIPMFAGNAPGEPPEDRGSRRARYLRIAGSVLICLLQASAGVYYAFFGCFMFVIAGAAAALQRKRLYPLYTAILLIGMSTAGVLANIGNHILYTRAHGANPEVGKRLPMEAEMYGMKIAQLLLPIPRHRVGRFAYWRSNYDLSSVSSTENSISALGTACSIGFCLLLGLLLCKRNKSDESSPLEGLTVLNVFTVLLATMGGLGSLFNILVTPQIRAYNRFSIFIAFFSLLALALVFKQYGDRLKSRRTQVLFGLLMLALLGMGLFDQTPRHVTPNYAAVKDRFQNDAQFVAQIEQALPEQSMVYQLPYMPFPEFPAIHRMGDYEHLRGYLHSSKLRWSYGQIRGRATANREKEIAMKPIPDQLPLLSMTGFSGIWIDRFGYEDNGAAVEKQLSQTLLVDPLVSPDARMSFFNMTKYNAWLKNEYSPDEWNRQKKQALEPLTVAWENGFWPNEGSAESDWHWCNAKGDIAIENPSQEARPCSILLHCTAAVPVPSKLTMTSDLFTADLTIDGNEQAFSKTVMVPPGRHLIKFSCDGQRLPTPPNEPRALYFRVTKTKIAEVRDGSSKSMAGKPGAKKL